MGRSKKELSLPNLKHCSEEQRPGEADVGEGHFLSGKDKPDH